MRVDRLTGFANLCRAYGVDVSPAEVAGFVHDVCRVDLDDAALVEEAAVGALARDVHAEAVVRKLFRLYFGRQVVGDVEAAPKPTEDRFAVRADTAELPEPARTLLRQAWELGLLSRPLGGEGRDQGDASGGANRHGRHTEQTQRARAQTNDGGAGSEGSADDECNAEEAQSGAGGQAGEQSDGREGAQGRGPRAGRDGRGRPGRVFGRGEAESLVQKLAEECAQLVGSGQMSADTPAALAAALDPSLARSFAARFASGLGAGMSPAKKERMQDAVSKLAARLLAEGFMSPDDAARLASFADDELRLGIVVSGAGLRSALHDAEALSALLDRYRKRRDILPVLVAKLVDALRYMMTKPSPVLEPSDLGSLDVRATIQASLPYGGVPLDFRYRRRREEHEIVLALDVSGSQRAWAASTVISAHALGRLLPRLRAFTFTADIHDVTQELRQPQRFIERLSDFGGFSNYETALTQLEGRAGLGRRTVLILVGDCRDAQGQWSKQTQGRFTRYIEPKSAAVMKRLVKRCRQVLVLNPEDESRWSSGDSAAYHYREAGASVLFVESPLHLAEMLAKWAVTPA